MIHYLTGDLFDSKAVALVNTVNLLGVMGKGVALQFKNRFPQNFKQYKAACQNGEIAIGKLFVTREATVFGEQLIINFPTKTDWRKPSEYSYIEAGLNDLIRVLNEYQIDSVALPPLGAGNGGLNWDNVKKLIDRKLADLDVEIYIYEPNSHIVEKMRAERIKLTPARALLLYVLYDLVRHGEYVSEFSSEKVCYFLQRFGAADLFKLHYEPKYYGPYSGKVKYVLNAMNGSYIMGYSDMNKKPFESLTLVSDVIDEITHFIKADEKLNEIATETMCFLHGFYSDFGLELLSSVDYIMCTYGKDISIDDIYLHLSEWSHRKEKLFHDKKYIALANKHLLESSIYCNS